MDKPAFSSSKPSYIILVLTASVVALLTAACIVLGLIGFDQSKLPFLREGTLNPMLMSFPFLLSLGLLVALLRGVAYEVTGFEDHLEVVSRGKRRPIKYSDIDSLSEIPMRGAWLFRIEHKTVDPEPSTESLWFFASSSFRPTVKRLMER